MSSLGDTIVELFDEGNGPMTFEIEQYQLHTERYRVKANGRGRGHSPTVQR